MESSISGFFINRFAPSGIFASRGTSKCFAILQFVLVTMILAYPLSLGMYRLDVSAVTEALFGIVIDNDGLGEKIKNAADGGESVVIKEGRTAVVYSPQSGETSAFESADVVLELHPGYSFIYFYGLKFFGDAPDFEAAFAEESAAGLLKKFAGGAIAAMFAFLAALMYPLAAVLNAIFLLAVAAMAQFLNYSAVVRLKFSEAFTFLCYAATIPAAIALTVGSFSGVAFVYVVYNFGVIFWAYFVYKRGQNSARRELIENSNNEFKI